ncbi:MAG: manganese efflux pump [Candidatus Eremiobacteraeota bacterium]|nr:manganese efflux pump [Candidatus Eremiobacteraeota bacterium]
MLALVLRVALVALSLALDVFAVSLGVGTRGTTSNAGKVRIGLAFAAAEVAMNLIGAGIGAVAGRAIGAVAAYIGFTALVGVGAYMIFESVRGDPQEFDLSRGWGLFVASLSISLDSLGIGFSIVYIGVPIVVTLSVIAVASLAATALGLAFGQRFGAAIGERAGLAAGFVLIATGVLFAILKYFNNS